MEPNKIFSVSAGNSPTENSGNLSSDKQDKSFIKEKKSSLKKNAAKEFSQLPPFYDELHFANYE